MNQPLNTRTGSAYFGFRVNAKLPTAASGTSLKRYITSLKILSNVSYFFRKFCLFSSFLGKLNDMFWNLSHIRLRYMPFMSFLNNVVIQTKISL